MKKQTKTEQVRKEVGDIFNCWLDKLEITGYATYIIMPSDREWTDPGDVSFTFKRQYPYKKILIYVSTDSYTFWKEKKHNLEKSLLHEAVHALLSDYTELAEKRYIGEEQLRDAEETLVDHITNNLLRNWSS